MRPKIRHRLPDIRLMVGENLGKTQPSRRNRGVKASPPYFTSKRTVLELPVEYGYDGYLLFCRITFFKVCHGSLYAVMWLVDEPREFNLPTLPQRCITYVPEKLPSKYGVHSEEYLPIRTVTPVVAECELFRNISEGGVHRYQNSGEVENRPIPGRQRISSLEEDALLFETDRQDPFRTANEIRAASNFPGSSQTVISRLRNRGIRSRRAAQMEILGEAQAVDRLAFATNRVDFDWRNVIFSDETTISSDYEGPVRVYREDGLRHDQRYVHRRERSGRFSISCWGWMSYDGPGVIERIDGRFNAGTYEHILENIFLPPPENVFPKEHCCSSRITIPCTMLQAFKDGFKGDQRSKSLIGLRSHLI
ncbi:hypothetical protein ANN_10330 [Periplaneta americana]|uniref:Transposase Tc1-like domain-containing protein n=1 Tax=Periplaneta americana TaxID=6978 RepID=A0ABQ8TNT2_PERAM|nr:hypothetical protein ANN_10330 [Periplaneta americana]